MNLTCTVCGEKYKSAVKSCNECGSQKFIEQEDDTFLTSGQVIAGRYKITDFLKSGGMGAVYKAEDTNLLKCCAIKELISISLDEEDYKLALGRFDREARILSELEHPGLPRVMDYFTLANRHYLIMDYIDGEDLESILRERGDNGLPEEEVVKWSLQICDVLHYLHTRKPPVIYRDIKPSNIMIRKSDGKITLIDFGIARTLAPGSIESLTITAVGTAGYMSPEQYRGKPEPRSDIYSLGATMHHLLTGKVPMPFTFEPLEDIRPDLSGHIKSLVGKALRMKISERFQTVLEMKEGLVKNVKTGEPFTEEPVLEMKEDLIKNVKPEETVTEESIKLDLLLNQLTIDDPDWRYIVIRTLKSHSDKSKMLETLINVVLNDPDLIVRREASEFLSNFEDKKILPLFNKVITDRDLEIRQTAIKVLERFKDPSSCQYLMMALSDSDQNISFKAAMCLLKMEEKKSLGEIFEFFKKQTGHIQSELEEAINSLDPDYLNEWRREKFQKIKKTEKKQIKFLIYLIIFIITGVIITEIYIQISMSWKYNNLMNEGKKLLEDYDYYSAAGCFTEALKLRPDELETLYCLGKTYIPLDQRMARFYLDKTLKLKKDYPEALMAKGKLYLVENNLKEAINYLEQAIKLKDDLPLGCIYLGEAFYKSGDKIKAEEIFKRALLSKDDLTVSYGSRWLKKIESEKLLPDKKQKIEYLLEEGKKSLDNLNYPDAGAAYQEIIDINPGDSRGYSGTGKVHLLRKNFDMSLQYLDKAVELDPVCTEAFCNIAFIYLQGDNYNQSIKCLNRAMDFDPFYPKIHYLAGLAYNKTGKKEEALKEFNIYLKLAPEGEYEGEIKNIMKTMEKK